ncbi:MAG: hypothetical protein KGI27_09870 [Thaumarchaeota archaeon]|nr:hypothetical protein [Nitrososphaerota archaeon]
MGRVIHEQTGLRIVTNDKNGFTICTLHYTADPRKRSPEWRDAARKGLKQAEFEQEYEIIYDAYMGQKVFPEIKSRRSEIIVREGPYEFNAWPKHLPMWGGFDYGKNNPSSFHVYTIVDGVTYALWELYEPCRNIFDFVSALKSCPYWDQIRYIAHDPDIDNFKERDMKTGGVTTVKRQFESLGISKWMRGNNDEQSWLIKMNQHWVPEQVTFKILECCPAMIDEFESATYTQMTHRQLETQNYKETMVNKHNHAMDDCKYFMNSNPNPVVRPLKYFNVASTYGWGGPEQRPSQRPSQLGLY